MPYGKGKHRRGTERVEQIGQNPVGGENLDTFHCKLCGMIPRVIGNDNAAAAKRRTVVFQFVGKPLGCLANGVDIHTVGAGAHDAAQSAGAKFQIAVKAILDFGLTHLF